MLVLESDGDYARYGIDRSALADILVVGPNGLEQTRRATQLAHARPAVDDQGRHDAAARGERRAREGREHVGRQAGRRELRRGPGRPAGRRRTRRRAARRAHGGVGGRGRGRATRGARTAVRTTAVGLGSLAARRLADEVTAGAPATQVSASRPPPAPPPPPPAAERRRMAREPMADVSSRIAAGDRDGERDSDDDGRETVAAAQRARAAHAASSPRSIARSARGNVDGALAKARAWHDREPGDVLALIGLGEALEASKDLAHRRAHLRLDHRSVPGPRRPPAVRRRAPRADRRRRARARGRHVSPRGRGAPRSPDRPPPARVRAAARRQARRGVRRDPRRARPAVSRTAGSRAASACSPRTPA